MEECYKKQPYEIHGHEYCRETVFITLYGIISLKTQESYISLVSLPVSTILSSSSSIAVSYSSPSSWYVFISCIFRNVIKETAFSLSPWLLESPEPNL